jgi:hypothetical protein
MLEVRKKIILNGIEYDGYKILSLIADFHTNGISIKVEYFAYNRKTTRDIKIEVGDEINLEDAIEQIHQIHNNITV